MLVGSGHCLNVFVQRCGDAITGSVKWDLRHKIRTILDFVANLQTIERIIIYECPLRSFLGECPVSMVFVKQTSSGIVV